MHLRRSGYAQSGVVSCDGSWQMGTLPVHPYFQNMVAVSTTAQTSTA